MVSAFTYDSCMSKTITIDDDVCKLLSSLKQGSSDSFTKVLRRYVRKPAETAGELLDAYESEPAASTDTIALKLFAGAEGAAIRRTLMIAGSRQQEAMVRFHSPAGFANSTAKDRNWKIKSAAGMRERIWHSWNAGPDGANGEPQENVGADDVVSSGTDSGK